MSEKVFTNTFFIGGVLGLLCTILSQFRFGLFLWNPILLALVIGPEIHSVVLWHLYYFTVVFLHYTIPAIILVFLTKKIYRKLDF